MLYALIQLIKSSEEWAEKEYKNRKTQIYLIAQNLKFDISAIKIISANQM